MIEYFFLMNYKGHITQHSLCLLGKKSYKLTWSIVGNAILITKCICKNKPSGRQLVEKQRDLYSSYKNISSPSETGVCIVIRALKRETCPVGCSSQFCQVGAQWRCRHNRLHLQALCMWGRQEEACSHPQLMSQTWSWRLPIITAIRRSVVVGYRSHLPSSCQVKTKLQIGPDAETNYSK